MSTLTALLCAVALALAPHGSQPATAPVHPRAAVPVGWQDEMNTLAGWHGIGSSNPADVYSERPGGMTLRLPHVPQGWPYAYQWSGVTATASDDLGRYPVLMARVSRLRPGSYAHLDLEMRDVNGKPVLTARSPTLVEAGVTAVDLGREWGICDVRRITIRLIVGGKNEGAQGEYDWVRFVRREDAPRLQAHPSTQSVVLRP